MKFKTKREKKKQPPPPPPPPPQSSSSTSSSQQQQHHQQNESTNSALKIFKRTMKEAANPKTSRFHNWDTESLKTLLVENNVQIRGSANASHSTLVRICDEVFGPFDDDNENNGCYQIDGRKDEESMVDEESTTKNSSSGKSGGGFSLNNNTSFTFEDLARMNWAAIRIQKLFIASRKRMYERMFNQQQQQQENQQQDYDNDYYVDQQEHYQEYEHDYDNEQVKCQAEYYDQEHDYGEEEYQDAEGRPLPSAPQVDEHDYYYEEHQGSNEEYSHDIYHQPNFANEHSVRHHMDNQLNLDTDGGDDTVHQSQEQPHSPQESDVEQPTEGNEDDLDEELDVEWRKPSWKFAKKYEAENRPHKSGKDMKKYNWRRDTLGRHCMMGGCGEQLDLWNEGATSEFSQFGSGITNYFKFLKWCSWIMLILSIVHVPAIIINILADSSGMEYESALAKTTLGNLGSAKEVNYITITGCEVDAYQFDACRWTKNNLALLYSSLDVIGTAIVIIGWIWLRTFEKREVEHLNRSTVNASDYTVRVTGIPSKTKERELAVHFANLTNEAVAEVCLVHKSAKAIQFYCARGKVMKDRVDCIQRIRYEKSTMTKGKRSTRKINRRVGKLINERRRLTAQLVMKDEERKENVKSNPDAIQAFVTFETEKGFLKSISSYQINWLRNFFCYPGRLLFKKKRLKLAQAPEPSTIIWENLEISNRSRLCRKCFTTFVASLAVLMSIYFTFLAKEFREELMKQTNKVCPEYLDDLTIDELSAVVNQNTDLSHCYCTKLDPQDQWNEDVCVEYVKGALKATTMNYGASFMVVFMNMFFTILMDMAGSFEKHDSLDAMESSNMTRVFLLKFVNTGCLILLYNVKLIQAIVGVRFEDPQNFNIDWFETGGVSMIIVMCINIVSPHISSLIQYRSYKGRIRKLETKGLTKNKETNDKFRVWYTQEELNAVYLGPPFRLNYRYTQCLVNFFICWMYSISMPILPFIGAISFYVSYWVDKFLFCNFYRIPPKYSDDIGSRSSSLIGYGILLHIMMSCWILGSNQIFIGQNVFGNYTNTYRWTKGMFKLHIIPLEVLGILFIIGLMIRRSLITFMNTILKFLNCLTCGLIGNSFRSNNIQRLQKTMNTVQVGYSAARARGVIKGLASYNILQNPKYQDAFAISSEFALSHRRLSSIRGYNTKEGGLCFSKSSLESSNSSSSNDDGDGRV